MTTRRGRSRSTFTRRDTILPLLRAGGWVRTDRMVRPD